MTEQDAKDWLITTFGMPAKRRIEQFHDLLIEGSGQQNLIAPSTLSHIWARHMVDSAQLVTYAPRNTPNWLDIGSGAGLPGIVIALLTDAEIILSEPRRLRAQFLQQCIDELKLGDRVHVLPRKVQNIDKWSQVISARAVAGLGAIFEASRHITHDDTIFVLPRGQSATADVAIAKQSWHGMFHVKPSVVNPQSGIVLATGVSPR